MIKLLYYLPLMNITTWRGANVVINIKTSDLFRFIKQVITHPYLLCRCKIIIIIYVIIYILFTTSVKKMSWWHIMMTYRHDDISWWHIVKMTYRHDDISWYVIMICHQDMSSRTSWNPAMTCNDICNDILRWHILMTPPSMTYLMTYCGNSTPWGH